LSILVEGLTLVRTRGEVEIHLSTASAAGAGFRGAFGIGVASLAAVTAGVASIPTPITEADNDNWLYHRFFSVIAADAIAVSGAASEALQGGMQAVRFEVDSKAMRKVPVGTALYGIVEVVLSGTAAAQFAFNSRMLFKLS